MAGLVKESRLDPTGSLKFMEVLSREVIGSHWIFEMHSDGSWNGAESRFGRWEPRGSCSRPRPGSK